MPVMLSTWGGQPSIQKSKIFTTPLPGQEERNVPGVDILLMDIHLNVRSY